jgi:hypothetical protein
MTASSGSSKIGVPMDHEIVTLEELHSLSAELLPHRETL